MESARTLAEVRLAFEATGLTVAEWADAEGFRRENVYAVLAGRSKGRRGESHRIAQALGLKAEASKAVVDLLLKNLHRPGSELAAGVVLEPQAEEGRPMR